MFALKLYVCFFLLHSKLHWRPKFKLCTFTKFTKSMKLTTYFSTDDVKHKLETVLYRIFSSLYRKCAARKNDIQRQMTKRCYNVILSVRVKVEIYQLSTSSTKHRHFCLAITYAISPAKNCMLVITCVYFVK